MDVTPVESVGPDELGSSIDPPTAVCTAGMLLGPPVKFWALMLEELRWRALVWNGGVVEVIFASVAGSLKETRRTGGVEAIVSTGTSDGGASNVLGFMVDVPHDTLTPAHNVAEYGAHRQHRGGAGAGGSTGAGTTGRTGTAGTHEAHMGRSERQGTQQRQTQGPTGAAQ